MAFIAATDLIRPFVEAGIVPDNCSRIQFDFPVHDVVRIRYEVFPTKDQIDAAMPTLIKSAELADTKETTIRLKTQAGKTAEAAVLKAAEAWRAKPGFGSNKLCKAVDKLRNERKLTETPQE